MQYINSEKIQKFVTAVETKKGFKPDANLILRHLFEEIGELSHAMWLNEGDSFICGLTGDHDCLSTNDMVASELIDIISLVNYIANVLKIDINEQFPKRMKRVARQYGVEYDPT